MARYVLVKDFITILLFLFLSSCLCSQPPQPRQISLQHNSGCDIPDCRVAGNTSVHLLYARAKGPNDSLHYIFSTVGPSPPTLLLLKSGASGILRVNWTQLLSEGNDAGAVKLVSEHGEENVKAEVENVIIFDKILEYNDTKDSVSINESTLFSPILLSHLLWKVTSLNGTQAQLMGSSESYPDTFQENSSVSFNLTIFGKLGQNQELPALPHNENSSDWTLSLDNLVSRGNGSRFSLKLLILSEDSSEISDSREKSINDEYCPAVFTMERINWRRGDPARTKKMESFAQWRTVGYTTNPPVRKFSTDVKMSDIVSVNKSSQYIHDVESNRLLVGYFGAKRLKKMTATSSVVSFGRPEDGFYSSSKFLSWTATVGFNTPPYDAFSTLIICVLVAGIACPLVVILFGGIYMICRLLTKKGNLRATKINSSYDYKPI